MTGYNHHRTLRFKPRFKPRFLQRLQIERDVSIPEQLPARGHSLAIPPTPERYAARNARAISASPPTNNTSITSVLNRLVGAK